MTQGQVAQDGVARCPVGTFPQRFGSLDKDPFEEMAKIGHQAPFWFRDPADTEGYWVVTRYEDALEILNDTDCFSSLHSFIPHMEMSEPMIPTLSDPPYTQKFRAILLPYMTLKRISGWEADMRLTAVKLIEGFRYRGECEFVSEFAQVFPIMMFLKFFGLPTERGKELREYSAQFFAALDDPHQIVEATGKNAWDSIRDILAEYVVKKRQNPCDDLLSAIANGKVDGEIMPLDLAISMAGNVFNGGLDTLPSNIGWNVRYLARNPQVRRQLINDPSLIAAAIEELLRMHTITNPHRSVKQDVMFQGANMKAGDRIFICSSSADKDPGEFGDGVRFDRETNRHLAFGGGPHRCLGSHFARLELGIVMEEWLRLVPDFIIDGDISYIGPVFAISKMNLKWDV